MVNSSQRMSIEFPDFLDASAFGFVFRHCRVVALLGSLPKSLLYSARSCLLKTESSYSDADKLNARGDTVLFKSSLAEIACIFG